MLGGFGAYRQFRTNLVRPAGWRSAFSDDAALAGFGGLALLLRVTPILGLWLVGGFLWRIIEPATAPNWATLIGFPIVVLGGYALAVVVLAVGLFLLRPLRPWFVGWVVSGYLISALVYGAIAIAGAVGFQYFGINLLDVESTREAWDLVRPVGLLGGIVGAVASAIWWLQRA